MRGAGTNDTIKGRGRLFETVGFDLKSQFRSGPDDLTIGFEQLPGRTPGMIHRIVPGALDDAAQPGSRPRLIRLQPARLHPTLSCTIIVRRFGL